MSRRLAGLALLLALVAAACGSSGGDDAEVGDSAVEEGATTSESDAPATTSDQWLVPYGLFVCGDGFVPPLPSQDVVNGASSGPEGIASIDPSTGATVGDVFESVGLDLQDDTIIVAGGDQLEEGFDCGDGTAVLQVARWSLAALDESPEVFTEGLADVSLTENFQVFTVAYLPEGAEIPTPPAVANLALLVDPAELPALPEGFTVAQVEPPGPGAAIDGETPCPTADSPRTTTFTEPPPECIDPAAQYTAIFTTSEGVVTVELDSAQMPSTVNNFIVLARYGYYDDTALFRTDPSIDIIQGGSPTTNAPGDPGPGYTIPDEGGEFVTDQESGQYVGPFTYTPGDLVMARSAGPDSSGAQFFFAAGPDTALLDSQGTYLNFGTTVEGLDVLEAILALHVDDPTSALGGGPSRAVVIESVEIIEG